MTTLADKNTIEYYNKNSRKYFDSTVNIYMESLYSPFLELIPPYGRILDAGCGSGRDSLYFMKKGYDVVAIDASEELVRLASALLGMAVLNMSFQELEFIEEFDGIWACGSLLHVPKNEIKDVLNRLSRSLRKDGIIYASFKYGNGVRLQEGRIFNNYNEDSLASLIKEDPSLKTSRMWKTEDLRKNRKGEYWLNVLTRKA
jgi:SAM-dependent methyltransferase